MRWSARGHSKKIRYIKSSFSKTGRVPPVIIGIIDVKHNTIITWPSMRGKVK